MDRRRAALWTFGFAMALLNLPFSTAMLSGCEMLLFVLTCCVRFPPGEPFAARLPQNATPRCNTE